MRKDGNAEIINSPSPSSCLRVRTQPGLSAQQVGILCDGSKVRLLSDAASVDGFIWWSIEGTDSTGKDVKGFAAEKSVDGASVFMKPVP